METVSSDLPFLDCDILTPYWAVCDLIFTIFFGAIATRCFIVYIRLFILFLLYNFTPLSGGDWMVTPSTPRGVRDMDSLDLYTYIYWGAFLSHTVRLYVELYIIYTHSVSESAIMLSKHLIKLYLHTQLPLHFIVNPFHCYHKDWLTNRFTLLTSD